MVQGMKIYVGHPSSIDFVEELYEPLKQSSIAEKHELVFPHEESDAPFDSREFLREDCDLFVAEVSEPSTGLGIELGWADRSGVPIICFFRQGTEPSSSLEALDTEVKEYSSLEELVELIQSSEHYE